MEARVSAPWCAVPLSFALLVAHGCSAPSRGPAVPEALQDQALIAHMTHRIRTWGDLVNPEFMDGLLDALHREEAASGVAASGGEMPAAQYLAISGGGANGAFGAGLLCGWTATGRRPEFNLITGISTGALTAPFAFLGPEYDHVLREVYTHTTTEDILVKRWIFAAIFNDALADDTPLWHLLDKYVDQNFLDRIAAEHRKGRVLLIGTSDLDAGRSVLWNVGEIAASGAPGALDLVRKIMIASASIPAAFPPVMLDVEVDGKHYQEMHVDGGAFTQVFLYPQSMKLEVLVKELAGVTRKRTAYVLRNSRLDAHWKEIERSTLSIAARAIDTLIETQGIGDLNRIYLDALRDGVEFNLASIPPTFRLVPNSAFDRDYMTQLFQVGYDMAIKGYPWQESPPGYAGAPAAKAP
jgi:hypothetical protein